MLPLLFLKNKRFLFSLQLLFSGVFLFVPSLVFAEDGSSGDPWIVNTCTELQAVGSGAGSWDLNEYYQLGNSFSCLGVDFQPLGVYPGSPFTGQLNGAGFAVSNLAINQVGDTRVGLFSYISGGTVRNINLTSGSVTGDDYVGAIVGQIIGVATLQDITSAIDVTADVGDSFSIGGIAGRSAGTDVSNRVTFDNVSSSGDVSGVDFGFAVAGIAGEVYHSSFQDVSFSGTVSWAGDNDLVNDIGGIVGYGDDAIDITNATVTGDVTVTVINSSGSDIYDIGGIAGYLHTGSTITDSSMSGDVTVTNSDDSGTITYVGGLLGYAFENGTVSNTSLSGDVILTADGDCDNCGGLVGYMDNGALVEDSEVTGNVTLASVTGACSECGGLVGEIQDDGIIRSSSLTGNLSVTTPGTCSNDGGLVGYMNDNSLIEDSFVDGLVQFDCGETGWATGGLVGWMNGGEITRSHVDQGFDLQVTGNDVSTAGGLLGAGDVVNITDSYVLGTMTLSSDVGGDSLGGLVGYLFAGSTVSQSYVSGTFTVTVAGALDSVGGLIGHMDEATVDESYADVDVATASSGGNTTQIGGLVGWQYDGEVNNSFALGDVEGDSQVGGLIGYLENGAVITTSYASGAVTGSNAGGLIGYIGLDGSDSNTVQRSFAAGEVTGSAPLGGLVGFYHGTVTFTSNYFDIFSTGETLCVAQDGGGTAGCTGVNAADSQPNYFINNSTNPPLNVWNFGSIWETNSCFYPSLQKVLFTALGGCDTVLPEAVEDEEDESEDDELDPPKNVTAVEREDGILVTWDDESHGEDGFKVYRKIEGGEYESIEKTQKNVEMYLDTDPLEEGATYVYLVRAYEGDHTGEESDRGRVTLRVTASRSRQVTDIPSAAEMKTGQLLIEEVREPVVINRFSDSDSGREKASENTAPSRLQESPFADEFRTVLLPPLSLMSFLFLGSILLLQVPFREAIRYLPFIGGTSAFPFYKKNRKYGLVLDAHTGRPLIGAKITVVESSGKSQAIMVNGAGMYVMLVPSGTYHISVEKEGYELRPGSVEARIHFEGRKVYQGEVITFVEPGIINYDLILFRNESPERPRAMNYLYRSNEKAFNIFSHMLFYSGFLVTSWFLIQEPTIVQACILFGYFIILYFDILGLIRANWGEVILKHTNRRAFFADITLNDIEGTLRARTVSDEYGRYYLFGERGLYQLLVQYTDITSGKAFAVKKAMSIYEKFGSLTKRLSLEERK